MPFWTQWKENEDNPPQLIPLSKVVLNVQPAEWLFVGGFTLLSMVGGYRFGSPWRKQSMAFGGINGAIGTLLVCYERSSKRIWIKNKNLKEGAMQ